jgi:photosystem II stability/assembly factor-like uncharacterized protein
MADENFGFATGRGGVILKTTTGGASWSVVRTSTEFLYSVTTVSPDVAWVAGYPAMLKTINGGQTWTLQDSSWYRSVSASDSQHARAVAKGWTNQVYTTNDGGTTWPGSAFGPGTEPRHVLVVDRHTAIVTTDSGSFRTIDGSTWASLGNTFVVPLAVAALDANAYTLVGWGGGISRMTPGPGISQYGGGADWGSGGVTNMFGACLQSIGGTTAPSAWTVNLDGTCSQSDGDTWYAVPPAMTKIATTALGDPGEARLVWGFRTASNQAKGTYSASVLIEALAPNA